MLYYRDAQCFFYWWVLGIFVEDFHADVVFDSVNLNWVSDSGFKIEDEKYGDYPTIDKAYIFSIMLGVMGRLQRIIVVTTQHFALSIIIIIMSCRLNGYPWPSLATSPYRSSPPADLQGYIPYPHIAAVCMFELVFLLLLGHMWGSIGVHHLWDRHNHKITDFS